MLKPNLLLFLSLFVSQLSFAQFFHAEYKIGGIVASDLRQFENLTGGQTWDEGKLGFVSHSLEADFKLRNKVWLGAAMRSTSFNQQALNSFEEISSLASKGRLQSFEARIWYKFLVAENSDFGSYLALGYSPLNFVTEEALFEDGQLLQRSSSVNGGTFQSRFGLKTIFFLKPISRLGITAHAYASPLLVSEDYNTGNVPSLTSIAMTGGTAGYQLGLVYKVLKFYAGLEFGNQYFSLGNNKNSLHHMKFNFSSLHAKIGLRL